MKDPKINVALTGTELHFLQSALYGNVDMGWHGNIQRADELHQRLETARESLKLSERARRLSQSVSA